MHILSPETVLDLLITLIFAESKSYSYFFSKNISIYAIFNDQCFNGTLTKDIVSFEPLGPGLCKSIEGHLNGQRYISEVPTPHVFPFLRQMSVVDPVTPSMTFFRANNVNKLIWHAMSPAPRTAFSNRDVCGHSQTKANFPFSCDSFQRSVANIHKLWRPVRIKSSYACS